MLLSVPAFPEISLVSFLSGVNGPDNKESAFEPLWSSRGATSSSLSHLKFTLETICSLGLWLLFMVRPLSYSKVSS